MNDMAFALLSAFVITSAFGLWLTWDMYKHDQAATILKKDRKIRFLKAYIKQEATRKESNHV